MKKYNEKNIRRDEHMKTKLSYFATSFMRKLEVGVAGSSRSNFHDKPRALYWRLVAVSAI